MLLLGQRSLGVPTVRVHASATQIVSAPVQHAGRKRAIQPQFRHVSVLDKLAAVADAVQLVRDGHALELSAEQALGALDNIYEELEEVFYSRHGYAISAREQRQIEATGGSATYGELMPSGCTSMMQVMCLPPLTAHTPLNSSSSSQVTSSSAQASTISDALNHLSSTTASGSSSSSTAAPDPPVFMDLGSGLGRVVLQAALTARSAFSRYIGIELSTSRHEQAAYALEALQQRCATAGDTAAAAALERVQFVLGDVTSSSLLAEATHVFMCSTAFGAVACRKIVEALHHSPRFQVLITSRELPFQPHLIKLGDFECETSWNACGTGHVYVRSDLRGAPPGLLRKYLSDDGAMCWLPSVQPHLPVAVQEPLEGWRVRKSGVVLQAAPDGGRAVSVLTTASSQ